MPAQQVFSGTPCVSLALGQWEGSSVSALGRCPEPKEGTGHLQRPVCCSPGASSVPSALPGTGETINACSALSPSDFPNPLTRLPEHGQSFQKGLSLLSDRNLAKEAVRPSHPGTSGPGPLTLPDRFHSSSLQDPCFFEDHAIKLSPSPVAVPVSSFHASRSLISHLLVDSNTPIGEPGGHP